MKKGVVTLIVFIMFAVSVTISNANTNIVVTDQLGRIVTVKKTPKRLVSLAPSITEIVYALGCEDRLMAATTYSDHPPAAKKLPRVGSYIRLDLEKIVAMKPDLCIAVKDGNPKETVMRIESFGIPVFAVNPNGIKTVIEAVEKLGLVLNAEKRAAQVAGDMKQRMDLIKSFTDTVDHRPGVFFQIGISPIVSTGSGTFLHELIELAGGRNLAKGPKSYPRFSTEQVISLKPEIIIITSMARAEIFYNVKKDWETWTQLPAVKNKRVYIVESDILDRPTPRLTDGLEMLTGIIHPGFKKISNHPSL